MYNYTLSLISGLIAMLSAVSSYFFNNRLRFLIAQGLALIMLGLSFLFLEQYFAMVSYGICIVRVLVYYYYEGKGVKTPLLIQTFFAVIAVCSYFIVNVYILRSQKPLDILLMCSIVTFTYVFGIRNLLLLRRLIIIPIIMTLIYNVLVGATVFVIVSYSFEAVANLTSIILFEYRKRKKRL